jgi:hypothetical protein
MMRISAEFDTIRIIAEHNTDRTGIDMYSIYINVNESQGQQLRPGFIRAGEVCRSTF